MSRLVDQAFIKNHCLFIRFLIKYPIYTNTSKISYDKNIVKSIERFSDILYCKPGSNNGRSRQFPYIEMVLAANEIDKLSKVITQLRALGTFEHSSSERPKEEVLDSLLERINEFESNENKKTPYIYNKVDNLYLDKYKQQFIIDVNFTKFRYNNKNLLLQWDDPSGLDKNDSILNDKIYFNAFKDYKPQKYLLGVSPLYFNSVHQLTQGLKEWLYDIDKVHDSKAMTDITNSVDKNTLDVLLHGFKGFK